MVELDLTRAAELIGSFVLVETVCDSEPIPEQYCMQLVGMAPPLPTSSSIPTFSSWTCSSPSKFPEELFWHNRSFSAPRRQALATNRSPKKELKEIGGRQ
ncbi:hypothetical protein IB274_20775 [Pseudomonas sp. PDM18]|uniref:hypothetical protein n=1 Tax=Pseudomonas sp. PDM18 TaxID=2769253 RepID=UPI00177D73EB|nr:hypothetical protein [Pseudomonas sp. PDM18]MBD9679154.1 hypothetical protein [Pseudomonas sp. PDM18]